MTRCTCHKVSWFLALGWQPSSCCAQHSVGVLHGQCQLRGIHKLQEIHPAVSRELPLHIRLWALVHVWTRMEGGRHTVRSKLDPKFASRCVPRTLVVSGTGPTSGGAETGACYTSGVQMARLDGLATIRVTAWKSRGQRRTITGRSASGRRHRRPQPWLPQRQWHRRSQ